jgi:hypothetical protein
VGTFRNFADLHEHGAPAESTVADLGERVAPPITIRPGRASVTAAAIGAVIGLLVGMAVFGYVHSVVVATLAGLAIVGAAVAISRRPRVEPAASANGMEEWRRKFMCVACGYVRELPA